MGLFDRVGRVVRAQVHHWVSQAEDPERLLEQAVQEMQDNLIELRQAVAQAIATQKRSERQFHQAETHAQEWQRRAHLALQNHQDELARQALVKRKDHLTQARALSEQIFQHQTLVGQLKQNMRDMEQQLLVARTKKDMYIARARSAEASSRLNQMRSNHGPASAAFERMEDRLLELEAKAELSAELGRDPVEEQFAALESDQGVEGELEAMRQQIQQQIRQQNSPQLPRLGGDRF